MDVPVQLNDPDELLEIYTPGGQPTGQGAPRGEVHLRGLWHCAFYCWVARPGPFGVEILLQHRSDTKDTNPGCFGASCAGHVRLGEPMADAVRELEEELGLREPLISLLAFGTHSDECVHANGLIDREHHALHLLARQVDDSELRPGPDEVQGLAWMPGSALVALIAGTTEAVTVPYLSVSQNRGTLAGQRRIEVNELVPYELHYYRRVVDVARDELRRKGLL